MSDIASLEMLLRYLIVALPVLVLIVLFFLLALGRRSDDSGAHDVDGQQGEPSPSLYARTQPSQTKPYQLDTLPRSASGVVAAVAVQPAACAPPPPTAADLEAEVARLEDVLAAAEDAGETVKLAEIHLALGHARLAAEEEAQGLDSFRSAAGLAALHKLPHLHAQARLELADAAIRHGDPTTACEHWQMARMAFLDAKAKVEGDKIDRLMRANGCPTDWVLTDF